MGILDKIKRWMVVPTRGTSAAVVEVSRENMLNQGVGANSYQDRGAAQRTPAQSTLNPYYEQNFYRRCQDYLKMYNTSWEVQKLITIPVDDAMKYRPELKGIDSDDAKRIWEIYDEKNLDQQNRRALIQERLLSGCGMLGIFKMDDPSTAQLARPLRLSDIQPGDFEAINIIDVTQLSIGAETYNPFSPNYDRQPNFQVNSVQVDRSRMTVLDGNPVVGRFTKSRLEGGRYNRIGFGESKITALYDIFKMVTGTQQGAFHLVNLASCLILEVEKFRSMRATNSPAVEALEQLAEHLSMYRASLIDAQGVKVSQHSASFGSVPELMMMFMQFLSAAGDVPAARYLGQAPGGLNATGESDLQNYYDMVRGSVQIAKLMPIQQREIDWIGCSLWGFPVWMKKRHALELEYRELWNETAKDKAERMGIYVSMIKSLLDSGAINGEAAIRELKARDVFATDIEAEQALDNPLPLEPSPIDPVGAIDKLRGQSAGFRKFNAEDWDESKHPRAEDGKFGKGGGGTDKGGSKSDIPFRAPPFDYGEHDRSEFLEPGGGSDGKTYAGGREGLKPIVERKQGVAKKIFDAAPTAMVTGKEIDLFDKNKDFNAIRDGMRDWAKIHGVTGSIKNIDMGWDKIEIRPKGIKDSMEHGASIDKVQAVPALPRLIQDGVYLETTRAHDEKQIGMVSHVFASKLDLAGKRMAVGFVIKEDMNGKRFYDHELMDMKNLDGLSPYSGAAPNPEESGGRPPSTRQGLTLSVLQKHLFVK